MDRRSDEARPHVDHALSACNATAITKNVFFFPRLADHGGLGIPRWQRYYTKSGYLKSLDE